MKINGKSNINKKLTLNYDGVEYEEYEVHVDERGNLDFLCQTPGGYNCSNCPLSYQCGRSCAGSDTYKVWKKCS